MLPLNKTYLTGNELKNIQEFFEQGPPDSNGPFTKKCHAWLRENLGCATALLTQSGTAALEMCAILCDIQPGDEVIVPSYTFVSTASAIALRGGIPVFVDVRYDTINLDEKLIEAAITEKTKAIFVVHYAGVPCEMDSILAIAKKHGLKVVEDNAHGVLSSYKGTKLGCLGDFSAFSFHYTKNLSSFEGGACGVRDASMSDRAMIVWEKGTNRHQFIEGKVDKYTWIDLGSSYLPSELTAAVLWGQLPAAVAINQDRLKTWYSYYEKLAPFEARGCLKRPTIPEGCEINAHIFYALLPSPTGGTDARDRVIQIAKEQKIQIYTHYVPLHSSPAGKRFGRVSGKNEADPLPVTERVHRELIRLPLWVGMTEEHINQVIKVFELAFPPVAALQTE